jgi:hypothetical protein
MGYPKKLDILQMIFLNLFVYWLWSNVGLEENVEFDQLPFTPAVVVFVLAYKVALFELGVIVVFVLPLLAVVFAWEKEDAVMDEKNIVPIIVTDKINPILKLVFLLLINITRSYLNIIALKYAASLKKVKILPMIHD